MLPWWASLLIIAAALPLILYQVVTATVAAVSGGKRPGAGAGSGSRKSSKQATGEKGQDLEEGEGEEVEEDEEDGHQQQYADPR